MIVTAGLVLALLASSLLLERPLCWAFGAWALSVIHAFFAAADLGGAMVVCWWMGRGACLDEAGDVP